MNIAIVIFYCIVCGLIIISIPFFKKSGISNQILISLFFIKIIVGIIYGLLMWWQQEKSGLPTDTWKYFEYSIDDTNLLIQDPKKFFNDLFVNQYGDNGFSTFWASSGSFWADFKNWVYIKIIAILNIITNKNYVANVVLINFLSFAGWVALFKLMHQHLQISKWLSIALVFFIPSTLFWNSGLHKDAFLCNSIFFSIYLFFKLLHKINKKTVFFLLIHVVIIFCFRFYSLVYLFTGFVTVYCIYQFKTSLRFLFVGFIAMFMGLILCSSFLSPSFSIPHIFLDKQQEFQKITSTSDFNIEPVSIQPLEFISQLPIALYHSMVMPTIKQVNKATYVFPAIESICCILSFTVLAMSMFIKRLKKHQTITQQYFIVFTFYFSVISFITLGFINVNLGSIIRYRSILFPCIFCSFFIISKQFYNKNRVI